MEEKRRGRRGEEATFKQAHRHPGALKIWGEQLKNVSEHLAQCYIGKTNYLDLRVVETPSPPQSSTLSYRELKTNLKPDSMPTHL